MRKRLFYQQSEPGSRQAQKTWRTSVLARIMMALFALMLIPQGTWAQIDYYSYNEASGAFEKAWASNYMTLSGSSETVDVSLTSDITYVCSESNVSYAGRIIVNGTVNIILCDGATLNATKGIQVGSGSILNIYGQELGTGQLNANGYTAGSSQFAAIGAYSSVMNSRNANRAPATNTLGSVIIHGGQINADSRNTNDAAGIFFRICYCYYLRWKSYSHRWHIWRWNWRRQVMCWWHGKNFGRRGCRYWWQWRQYLW